MNVVPENFNGESKESTPEERCLKAQLDAANDMWGHFKRLASEKADANAVYKKRIVQLKKDVAKEKAAANAAYEKRIAQLIRDAAAEKADTNSAHEKRIARLKKDTKTLQVELQAVCKDRDALLAYADVLELLLRRVLSSRTWRIMEPVRIVGRWLRAIISHRKPVREPLPTRPKLPTVTRDAVQSDAQ